MTVKIVHGLISIVADSSARSTRSPGESGQTQSPSNIIKFSSIAATKSASSNEAVLLSVRSPSRSASNSDRVQSVEKAKAVANDAAESIRSEASSDEIHSKLRTSGRSSSGHTLV